jgi:hypothetical protein
MSSNFSQGIYCSYFDNAIYNFNYSLTDPSYSFNTLNLITYSANTYAAGFSYNNSRVAVSTNNTIYLYLNCISPFCAYCDTTRECTSCITGHYSSGSVRDCSYICNRVCITCSNSTSCDTCVISSPIRILTSFCACPLGTADDRVHA